MLVKWILKLRWRYIGVLTLPSPRKMLSIERDGPNGGERGVINGESSSACVEVCETFRRWEGRTLDVGGARNWDWMEGISSDPSVGDMYGRAKSLCKLTFASLYRLLLAFPTTAVEHASVSLQ